MQTYKAFREPTPYEVEKQRAERQRRYAELLQQQAMAPEEEPYTFQGFRAMPSPANALSRVLQAYAAKKVGEKAEQAEARAREADVAGMTELQRSLGPQTRVVAPDMFADPMGMASKYTPPVTETTMPTYQQRETLLTNALASGTPSAQRLAQLMLGRQPQITMEALMSASPESRREYQETGDPSVLELAPKASNLPGEVETYQYYVTDQQRLNKPIKSFEEWRLTKPPSTSITNVIPSEKTTTAYTTALSGKLAEQDAADIALGEQSLPQIEASFRVRDLLKQNPITGTGATARLALERALATAGFSKGQKASVTENLAAELGKVTLAAIPTSGLGSGQGFTGSDREFLEKAAAGTLELTNANLQYLAELNEKVARANIQRSNRTRARLRKIPEFSGLGDRFPDVVAPPAYGSQLPPGAVLDPSPR
jgi:hypothetical protein